MSRDYLFYGKGFEPRRLRWVVVPARRTLRRLLRPMFYRQVELFEELDADLQQLKARLDDLEGKINGLDENIRSIAALGWDHVALTRRLATLEDRVHSSEQWSGARRLT